MDKNITLINRLSDNLSKLLPMKKEYQALLDKKVRLEFNFNSNHIEGNTLTYGETELLLVFGKTTGNHDLREYEEMKAHDVAFDMIQEWATDDERPLSEMAIKELHKILLVRPFWKEAETPEGQDTRRLIEVGTYKKYPNSVRLQNGEMFHYTTPEETPIQMGELISWYRSEEEKAELHPVTLAALVHYKFVCIHPFDDGNGRISRLIMNYILIRNGLPPVVIKSAEKKAYLFALNQGDTGDLEAFVTYIQERVIESLQLFIRGASGEDLAESGDIDKKISLLKRKFGQKAAEQLKSSYTPKLVANIIKKDARKLVLKWAESQSRFETLFISKSVKVSWDGQEKTGTDLIEIFTELIETLELEKIYESKPIGHFYKYFIIESNFVKLVGEIPSKIYNAGQIQIHFYVNGYEIHYTPSKMPIRKSYNQHIGERQTREMIDAMANELIRLIEEGQ